MSNETPFKPGELEAWQKQYLGAQPEPIEQLAARVAGLMRVADAAQALTDGATDTGEDFIVPSHLMAALALALDELKEKQA